MDFDRVAPYYRRLERLTMGRVQEEARVHWLPEVGGARQGLLVGEGDGHFLEAALRACPEARFTVVEPSARMLELARRTAGAATRIEFVQAALPDWRPAAGRFDLIVTNFFFDCFNGEEVQRLIPAIARGAAAECTWLVAEYAAALSWRQRVLLAGAYAFFRWTAGVRAHGVPPYAALMEAQGFRLLGEQRFGREMVAAQRWIRPPTK